MYAREITEASKSALLELGLALKRYHEDIVLTGGWAPHFISKDHFQHCGSIDIDLALKTDIMPKYDTIRKTVEDLGYVELNPFRFSRAIKSPIDGKDYDMHLDFLCEKEGMKYVDLRKVQDDLHAFAFDGLSLAFDFNFEQTIETVLPGNGEAKTTFKVIDLPGSLALKGQALEGRAKHKDSYDIFALKHFNGGPVQAAQYCNDRIAGKKLCAANQELLIPSIKIISGKFKNAAQMGPFHVETFTENKYKRQQVAAQVNAFLVKLII